MVKEIFIYNFAALFSTSDAEQLAKEVSTMLQFEHTNVMSLKGVCVDGDIPLIIMPFMTNGCVLEFVKHHKAELLCITATEAQVHCCNIRLASAQCLY